MNIRSNESGLTLVEVLAAFAIASIISIFVISILMTTSKEDVKQKNDTKQLFDETYTLKVITKDIRKSDPILINHSDINDAATLTLNQPNGKKIVYEFKDSKLTKKITVSGSTTETVIADNLTCFEFAGNRTEEVKIKTSAKLNCSELTEYQTVIKLRKE